MRLQGTSRNTGKLSMPDQMDAVVFDPGSKERELHPVFPRVEPATLRSQQRHSAQPFPPPALSSVGLFVVSFNQLCSLKQDT